MGCEKISAQCRVKICVEYFGDGKKIKIKVFGHDHGPAYRFDPEKIRIKGTIRSELLEADEKWGQFYSFTLIIY